MFTKKVLWVLLQDFGFVAMSLVEFCYEFSVVVDFLRGGCEFRCGGGGFAVNFLGFFLDKR